MSSRVRAHSASIAIRPSFTSRSTSWVYCNDHRRSATTVGNMTARRPLLLVILALFVIESQAQFRLPKKLPKIPGLDRIPGLDKIMGKEPPVTTSLADALTEVAFLDNFSPELPLPLG